jgi:hypothetical protein
MWCIMCAEEECPYGERSDLPGDEPLFEIMTPQGSTPEDVLPGGSGITLNGNKNIMITLSEEPLSFFLMDLQYTATQPTEVTITFSDDSTYEEEVSLSAKISAVK